MAVLHEIAYYRKIRSEVPNQVLARKLAEEQDITGIAEIASHLQDKNTSVASDCIKVLYEVGYLNPDLILRYAEDFVKLTTSRRNRMVWGGMIALSTIADRNAPAILPHLLDILRVMEQGTVITLVSGVRMLGKLLSAEPQAADAAMPFLTHLLTTCIPRDVATHGESLLPMIRPENETIFRNLFESRMVDMSAAQARRMRAVLKKIDAICA